MTSAMRSKLSEARTAADKSVKDKSTSTPLSELLPSLHLVDPPAAASADQPTAPVAEQPAEELASRIVWFDAYVSNVDRTPRNTNLLMWHRQLRLIDHGAALYFHHGWDGGSAIAGNSFKLIKDHVLLPWASALPEADAVLAAKLGRDLLQNIVAQVPDGWLLNADAFADPPTQRAAYVEYLVQRLDQRQSFVQEAIHARR